MESARATILVVDDHRALVHLLRQALESHGYRVLIATDGLQALKLLQRHTPDLVLLDIMMPQLDGLTLLRRLRQQGDIPVILLTARVGVQDRVLGLELGADDYITKPFHMEELLARVRAVLRRSRKHAEAPAPTPTRLLRLGEITVDLEQRRVWVNHKEVPLTPSEFALLTLLMRHPGRVFTREELLEHLPGRAREGGWERTVDSHIAHLRAKIETDPRHPRYILTVRGVGYRFAPQAWLRGDQS